MKGEAIVSVKKSYSYSHYHLYNAGVDDASIKTIKIDGKGSVEFDVETDLKPKFGEYPTSLTYDIQAIVIEELTGKNNLTEKNKKKITEFRLFIGRNQSVSKTITLHKTKYKIVDTGKKYEFNVGLPIKFDVSTKSDHVFLLITN